jgi:hypothetical protein
MAPIVSPPAPYWRWIVMTGIGRLLVGKYRRQTIGVTDMTRDRDFKDLVGTRMAKTGESYAVARAQLTKPSRGEVFESGTAEDGTAVYRMYTRLQTPEKGWSGLAIPSDLLGTRARLWLRGTLQGHPFWVAAQPMSDGNHWVTVNR